MLLGHRNRKHWQIISNNIITNISKTIYLYADMLEVSRDKWVCVKFSTECCRLLLGHRHNICQDVHYNICYFINQEHT